MDCDWLTADLVLFRCESVLEGFFKFAAVIVSVASWGADPNSELVIIRKWIHQTA